MYCLGVRDLAKESLITDYKSKEWTRDLLQGMGLAGEGGETPFPRLTEMEAATSYFFMSARPTSQSVTRDAETIVPSC